MICPRKGALVLTVAFFALLYQGAGRAQNWDYPAEFGNWGSDQTQGKL